MASWASLVLPSESPESLIELASEVRIVRRGFDDAHESGIVLESPFFQPQFGEQFRGGGILDCPGSGLLGFLGIAIPGRDVSVRVIEIGTRQRSAVVVNQDESRVYSTITGSIL